MIVVGVARLIARGIDACFHVIGGAFSLVGACKLEHPLLGVVGIGGVVVWSSCW